jgi:ankyrin repeat protein
VRVYSNVCALVFAWASLLAAASSDVKQPEVNRPEADGTTALDHAVRQDDLKEAQALLRAGANPKAANRYGVTPLFLAATNGNAEMAESLLKARADANAALPGGQTVLMTAARTGNPDVVKVLLSHGAVVDAKESNYGETALMWAAAENHPDAAKVLIEHGAEVNMRSAPLEYSKDRFGLEGVVTILPHGHWTALMYAARQGSLATARVLADARADLNLMDPDRTTALVLAIINAHYDTAVMLLDKGADPNIADSAGMAALYAAVDMSTLGEVYGRPSRTFSDESDPLDLMKALVRHGAKVNAQLRTPALYRAHTPGDGNLGEGSTPLMRAARNADAPAMRLLLASGADASLRQKNGTTALMLAAGLGHGLGVFAKEYATEPAMLEAVKILVEQHVDVNAANDAGETALHFAALASDPVVKFLADNGANLNAKDRQGRTALDMALGRGGRGRAGEAPKVRESTVTLLRQLMDTNLSVQ